MSEIYMYHEIEILTTPRITYSLHQEELYYPNDDTTVITYAPTMDVTTQHEHSNNKWNIYNDMYTPRPIYDLVYILPCAILVNLWIIYIYWYY